MLDIGNHMGFFPICQPKVKILKLKEYKFLFLNRLFDLSPINQIDYAVQ